MALSHPRPSRVPESVRAILAEHLTDKGIEQWWATYVHLDPFEQEGHAREHARCLAERLNLGQGKGT